MDKVQKTIGSQDGFCSCGIEKNVSAPLLSGKQCLTVTLDSRKTSQVLHVNKDSCHCCEKDSGVNSRT
jgi:hypothetical protein